MFGRKKREWAGIGSWNGTVDATRLMEIARLLSSVDTVRTVEIHIENNRLYIGFVYVGPDSKEFPCTLHEPNAIYNDRVRGFDMDSLTESRYALRLPVKTTWGTVSGIMDALHKASSRAEQEFAKVFFGIGEGR